MDPAQFAAIVAVIKGFADAKYLCISSLILLVWDILVTFDDELRYFWTRPLTWSRVLFFLNRYLSVIFTLVQFYGVASASPPVAVCRSVSACVLYGSFMTMTFSTLVLLMRTYALYKRQQNITRLLLLIFIAIWAVAFALIIDLHRQLAFAPDLQALVGGCTFSSAGNGVSIWRIYVPTLILQTILSVMTLYKGLWLPVRGEYAKGVMRLLVRDGAVVYIVQLAIVVISITGSLVDSIKIPTTVSNLILPASSVCTSRMLLNLRAHLSGPSNGHGFLSAVEMTGLYMGGYKGGIAPARGVEGATVREIGNTTVIEVPVNEREEKPGSTREGGGRPLVISALGAATQWERWDMRLPNKDVKVPPVPAFRESTLEFDLDVLEERAAVEEELERDRLEASTSGFQVDLPELTGRSGGSRRLKRETSADTYRRDNSASRPTTSATDQASIKKGLPLGSVNDDYEDQDLEQQTPKIYRR